MFFFDFRNTVYKLKIQLKNILSQESLHFPSYIESVSVIDEGTKSIKQIGFK